MIDVNTKKSLLENILSSKTFSGSKTYGLLLKYLVDCSINGKSPKEQNIAVEVLQKNEDFDPSIDTSVRVYIHKLRKSLDKYYQNEGKHDKIKLEIPKGHYDVNFVLRHRFRKGIDSFGYSIKKLFYVLPWVLLIASLSYIYLFQPTKNAETEQNLNNTFHFLAHFMDDTHPKLVVLGDRFFYKERHTNTGRETWVRDYTINSKNEFEAYKNEYPDENILYRPDVFFFSREVVWPLQYIMPVLVNAKSKFSFYLASTLTYHELQNNDIIFIGNYNATGVLKDVLEKLYFKYDRKNHNIQAVFYPDSIITYSFDPGAEEFHRDYCLLTLIPGPAKNNILIITGSHATGVTGMARYISDPSNFFEVEKLFVKKFHKMPDYYQLLLEVKGYDRRPFTTEIKAFYPIEENKGIWWE